MNKSDEDRLFATDLENAPSDIYSEQIYGGEAVVDQDDALEAFHAYDDGTLAEAPQALAAYVNFQQHCVD